MQENKKRFLYIDCIKGVMILFVLYYHIMWLGVKFKDSPTKEFFDLVCMQSFFFISGFVSYRQVIDCHFRDIVYDIRKKIVRLLLPTIVMFLFCCFYYKLDINYYVHNEFKSGYWFTYVLFLIFLLHSLVNYLVNKLSEKIRMKQTVADIILVIMGGCLYFAYDRIYGMLNNEFYKIFSLQFVLKYYIFYVIGYIARKYELLFEKFIVDNTFSIFVLLIVASCPMLFAEIDLSKKVIQLIVSLSQVIFVYICFKKATCFQKENRLSHHLALMGKYSMSIYFLHYYFIFNIPYALQFISYEQEASICFRGAGNYLLPEILVILPVAIILAYFSIGIRKIVDYVPFLSNFLFGPSPK